MKATCRSKAAAYNPDDLEDELLISVISDCTQDNSNKNNSGDMANDLSEPATKSESTTSFKYDVGNVRNRSIVRLQDVQIMAEEFEDNIAVVSIRSTGVSAVSDN